MKTIVIATLAVALASPAFAQEWATESSRTEGFAQSWREPALRPADAFAQGSILDPRVHLGNPAWHVYNGSGEYVGTDPDPFIRNDLARDPPGRNED
jgi:hypothetical protein